MTTCAPFSTNSLAVALPMPLLPPVMTATLSLRRLIYFLHIDLGVKYGFDLCSISPWLGISLLLPEFECQTF